MMCLRSPRLTRRHRWPSVYTSCNGGRRVYVSELLNLRGIRLANEREASCGIYMSTDELHPPAVIYTENIPISRTAVRSSPFETRYLSYLSLTRDYTTGFQTTSSGADTRASHVHATIPEMCLCA